MTGVDPGYSHAVNPAIEESVRRRCVEQLFGAGRSAIVGSLMVSVLYGWIVWDLVDHLNIISWAIVLGLVAVVRFMLGISFSRHRFQRRTSTQWLSLFNKVIYLNSVVWAVGVWLLFPVDVAAQALIMVLFAGVSSIAVQTLCWSRPAVLATIAATMVALAAMVFTQLDSTHLIMGAMIGFYSLLLLRLANSTNRVQLDTFRLQADNAELVADLQEVNRRSEELNIYLKQEVEAKEKVAQELAISSAAKSQFLSSMSHELRTPLNAILGFAQILKMDQRHQEASEHGNYLDEIMQAGDHLLLLINDVLDLAKIESGKAMLDMKDVAVGDLLVRAVSMVAPMARDQGIHIDAGSIINEQRRVRADATRLRQVVINLLSNAIKYNRPQGHVQLCVDQEDETSLRILVRDTGQGIDEDLKSRLFQPFERGSASHSSIQGTGIGLSICKELMELMDGEIGVESVRGEGTEFWVRLQLVQASAAVT